MRKLLKANFARLRKSKVFVASCLLLFFLSVVFLVTHWIDNQKNGAAWTLDATLFSYAFLLPVLLAVTSALFVGSEYSDGTIRNKITVGHRRHVVYLSELLVCVAAGVGMSVAYLFAHFTLGIALFGRPASAPQTLLLYGALHFALLVAFAAIFVLIAMLCQNKAYSTAGCILLTFALLFVGIHIVSALQEPEYYAPYSYTESGVTTEEGATPNPNYLRGAKRQAYDFLYDFTPGGQVLQLGNQNAAHPGRLALWDGLLFAFSTGGGMWLFRRKDLK